MGRGKDLKKRKRQLKTDAEKEATRIEKEARKDTERKNKDVAKRRDEQRKYGSVASFFAEEASIAWCKLVDGIRVFPKLPVHIRSHKEAFERKQCVRNCVKRAECGQKLLDELNKATKPKLSENAEAVKCAEAMPAIHPDARHDLPYVITAGTAIGNIPDEGKGRKRGG